MIFENQEGFGDSLLPSETIGFFVVYHENRYTGGRKDEKEAFCTIFGRIDFLWAGRLFIQC